MLFRRFLLLFPLIFLAVAFAGLLARPSDFLFPYSFAEEGLKTLKRFSYVWAALLLIYALRKSPFIQRGLDALSRVNRGRFLFTVLALSFLLRLAWCVVTDYEPVSDSLWFMKTAKNLLAGKGFSADGINPTAVAPPAFSFFLAFVYRVFGERLIVLQAVQSLMDVSGVFFIFLIAEKLFGRTAAYLTAFFHAFSFNQLLVSPMVINEHLFTFVVFPAFYLLVSDLEKGSWKKLLAAGILLGISNLTRGVLALFPPFLFFLYLFSGRKWKLSLLKAGLVTLVSLGVVLPWTYRNYRVMGYPVPVCTSAGYGFYTINHPQADPYVSYMVEMQTAHPEFRAFHPNFEVASYLGGGRYAKEWILSDPWRFIRLGAGKLINLYGVNTYWSLVENLAKEESARRKIIERIFKKPMRYGYMVHFTLFVIGIFLLIARYGWRTFDAKKMFLLLVIFFWTGMHLLFAGPKRYRYPMEPLIYMTSAFTLVSLFRGKLDASSS